MAITLEQPQMGTQRDARRSLQLANALNTFRLISKMLETDRWEKYPFTEGDHMQPEFWVARHRVLQPDLNMIRGNVIPGAFSVTHEPSDHTSYRVHVWSGGAESTTSFTEKDGSGFGSTISAEEILEEGNDHHLRPFVRQAELTFNALVKYLPKGV